MGFTSILIFMFIKCPAFKISFALKAMISDFIFSDDTFSTREHPLTTLSMHENALNQQKVLNTLYFTFYAIGFSLIVLLL